MRNSRGRQISSKKQGLSTTRSCRRRQGGKAFIDAKFITNQNVEKMKISTGRGGNSPSRCGGDEPVQGGSISHPGKPRDRSPVASNEGGGASHVNSGGVGGKAYQNRIVGTEQHRELAAKGHAVN